MSIRSNFDDSSEYSDLYQDGAWVWDDNKEELEFVKHPELPYKQFERRSSKCISFTGVRFHHDIDIMEQMRFRHRYQRKVNVGEDDVVTLQDVKDVVIFTAPVNILSKMLINMLHLATTERFIRALILYCQYYLQVSVEMEKRMTVKKIRTPQSELIEKEYSDDLCDLRLLVAKEYSTIIIGGEDTIKYHHMGIKKKRSFTDRDAQFYETLICMCIQIVYIALGRKNYNLIELEVYRLFKTEIFNTIEQRTKHYASMKKEIRNVLLGPCAQRTKNIKMLSPMVKEVFCHRNIDHRIMDVGVVKNDNLPPRLLFLQRAIIAPEERFKEFNTVVGILGMPRSQFNTMLFPLSLPSNESEMKMRQSFAFKKDLLKRSSNSLEKSTSVIGRKGKKPFPDIQLPKKIAGGQSLSLSFVAGILEKPRPCHIEQRDRWLQRLEIIQARKSRSSAERKL